MHIRRRLHATEIVQRRARELRKQMTRAEILLWEQLRGRKLQGLKFRRQEPIDHYIVDFFCHACRLIVELDGEVHTGQQDLDQDRTGYLESKGYRVIRFRNEEVEDNIQAVLKTILAASRDQS